VGKGKYKGKLEVFEEIRGTVCGLALRDFADVKDLEASHWKIVGGGKKVGVRGASNKL